VQERNEIKTKTKKVRLIRQPRVFILHDYSGFMDFLARERQRVSTTSTSDARHFLPVKT
ncbi:unnamed protein product, partial [Amoebophrya sp. A25]